MKIFRNKKTAVIFSILMGMSVFCFAKPGTAEDDIFKHEKIEKDDFLEIKKEPKKADLKKGVNKNLDDVKAKKKETLDQKNALQKKALDDKKKALEKLEEKKKGKKETPPKKVPALREDSKDQVVALEKEEAALDKNISLREKFLDFCMGLKGTKYTWGGKTPSTGLDCSGLITYGAKKSIGINLTGSAQNIYDETEHIPLSEAVPGDLVFFKAAGDSRITHVGIYLGQNQSSNDFGNQNLFLNSASAGPRTGVIVSGMDENYWKKTYYGCGRFLEKI